MQTLVNAIYTTPIIDHHAHNLLRPEHVDQRPFLSVTSEATGPALSYATSTLAHLRAVRQLADIVDCKPNWEDVRRAAKKKRAEPDLGWSRRCFEGIECALIDDGLERNTVHPYGWHSQLTRSECKRIVRIESVAEELLEERLEALREAGENSESSRSQAVMDLLDDFFSRMKEIYSDPNVVGFKSIICYRSGLDIPTSNNVVVRNVQRALSDMINSSQLRIEDHELCSWFVHATARVILSESEGLQHAKPIQFHTGLGDNDINLKLSSPSQLQAFIAEYHSVPIVLLHASYPFTQEAGYLASVYENVYLDIGEVFPMVSRDGQERILREALELCPSKKLMWSTDGHFFPETFLLAVIQIRIALEQVLGVYVRDKTLDVSEAITFVEDMLFSTANRLYDLRLDLKPLLSPSHTGSSLTRQPSRSTLESNVSLFETFCHQNPTTKYLRLQWLDYTSTPRGRVISTRRALTMLKQGRYVAVIKVLLSLLQNDKLAPGCRPIGEYNLYPCFDSLRFAERNSHATVQCEFRESDGREVLECPRTVLRKLLEGASDEGREFVVGFEIEVVFLTSKVVDGAFTYGHTPVDQGHAWSNLHPLQDDDMTDMLEQIHEALENCDIDIIQFHAESGPGQYEFVMGPMPPLQAVDALLAAREIIATVAMKRSLKASFAPKASAAGTGCHVHLSMSPSTDYESFYAGVLRHLPALAAFTCPNVSSYDRVGDSNWSGGTWVGWGTQNRETPLRKIVDSHWEIKLFDGTANPYLALTAILCAGLQGLRTAEPLTWADCQDDPAKLEEEELDDLGMTERIPHTWEGAWRRLEIDEELKELVGEAAVKTYMAVKEAERGLLVGMEAEKMRNWLIERY